MKISSILKATAVCTAITGTSVALADPIYTMENAVVTSQLTVSGCSALPLGGLADVTFDEDGTYELVRDIPEIPAPLIGTWTPLTSGKTTTLYMAANNDDPGPLEEPPVPGSISEMFDAFDVVIKANCALKYGSPAGDTVSIIRPSVLASKSSLVIKTNKDGTKSGVLTLSLKGKQVNAFKGTAKYGTFAATITVKGIVTEATTIL